MPVKILTASTARSYIIFFHKLMFFCFEAIFELKRNGSMSSFRNSARHFNQTLENEFRIFAGVPSGQGQVGFNLDLKSKVCPRSLDSNIIPFSAFQFLRLLYHILYIWTVEGCWYLKAVDCWRLLIFELLKFWKAVEGTNERPRQSQFGKGTGGIHGPLIRSEFLKGKAGIRTDSVVRRSLHPL